MEWLLLKYITAFIRGKRKTSTQTKQGIEHHQIRLHVDAHHSTLKILNFTFSSFLIVDYSTEIKWTKQK